MTVTSKLLAQRINPQRINPRLAYPLRRHSVGSIREVLQHPVKNFAPAVLFQKRRGQRRSSAIPEVPLPHLFSCTTISDSVIPSRQVLQSVPFPFRPTLFPLQNSISASWGIQQASEMHHNTPFTTGPLFFIMPVPVRFLSKCLPAGGKKGIISILAIESKARKVIETRKHSTRGVDSEQPLLHAIASPNPSTNHEIV